MKEFVEFMNKRMEKLDKIYSINHPIARAENTIILFKFLELQKENRDNGLLK